MIINPVKLREDSAYAMVESGIEFADRKEKLWYLVDKQYAPYLTLEKLDGFVVGLLPLAMEMGEDIVVRGPVSEKLFHNLTRHYMNILRLITPSFKSISIIPDSLNDAGDYTCEGAVATGFSAGIDSFCTVYDYLVSDVSPRYKITHFIFNNAGSHGEWDSQEARARFNSRYIMNKGFADRYGIDFIKIDSNLSDILKMNFQKTHVSRNISCVLVLQKLFGKFLYSSGMSYRDSFIGEANDQAYADPSSVHLLSSETLECISVGSQYSRIEKTRKVAAIADADRWLNVCLTPKDPEKPENCSQCGKCLLTLFTLELLGVIGRFGKVFNLDIWRQQRRGYIITVILGKNQDPLVREVREYVKSIGFSFSAWQRVAGWTLRLFPSRVTRVIICGYRWMKWIALHRKNELVAGPGEKAGHG